MWLPAHRASKTALGALRALDPEIVAYNFALILDLDKCPGIQAPQMQDYLAHHLGTRPVVYSTRNGCHLIWPFEQPCPSWLYRSVCQQMVDRVAQLVGTGAFVDPSVVEWDRVFRCPWATRDGKLLEPSIAPDCDTIDWRAFDPEPEEKWVKVKAATGATPASQELVAAVSELSPKVLQSLTNMNDLRGARVLQGQEWLGEDGDRNHYLLQLTGRLATILQHEPLADEHVIAELLRPACDMTPQTENWHETALRMASHAWHNQQVEARATSRDTWPAAFDRQPQANGVTGAVPLNPLPISILQDPQHSQTWILQDSLTPTDCYVWNQKHQRYVRAKYVKSDLHRICKKAGLPIFFNDIANRFPEHRQRCLLLLENSDKPFASAEFLQEIYVSLVDVEFDGTVQSPHFHGWHPDIDPYPSEATLPAGRMRETLPRAEFVRWVDLWLREMFGKDYEIFAQWLVRFPMLDKPLSMLSLIGPPGCGKSFLVSALGGFFTKTCPFHIAMSPYQDPLLETPVVMATEDVSDGTISLRAGARLRQLIDTDSQRTINRKGLTAVSIGLNPRVMGTFNGMHKMRTIVGHGTEREVRANLERVFLTKISEEQGARLRELMPKPDDMDPVQFQQMQAHLRFIMEFTEPMVEKGRFGPVPQQTRKDRMTFRSDTRPFLEALNGTASAIQEMRIGAGHNANLFRYTVDETREEIWVSAQTIDYGLRVFAKSKRRWADMRDSYNDPNTDSLPKRPRPCKIPNQDIPVQRYYKFTLAFLEELSEACGVEIDLLKEVKQFPARHPQ